MKGQGQWSGSGLKGQGVTVRAQGYGVAAWMAEIACVPSLYRTEASPVGLPDASSPSVPTAIVSIASVSIAMVSREMPPRTSGPGERTLSLAALRERTVPGSPCASAPSTGSVRELRAPQAAGRPEAAARLHVNTAHCLPRRCLARPELRCRGRPVRRSAGVSPRRPRPPRSHRHTGAV